MNKAVSTTNCGIDIVSEVIKWEVRWDGRWAEGARYMLSPDAPMASCPAKNQTSGSIFPASTAAVESEQKSRLYSGHEIWVFSGERRWTGSWNYLHVVTDYGREQTYRSDGCSITRVRDCCVMAANSLFMYFLQSDSKHKASWQHYTVYYQIYYIQQANIFNSLPAATQWVSWTLTFPPWLSRICDRNNV